MREQRNGRRKRVDCLQRIVDRRPGLRRGRLVEPWGRRLAGQGHGRVPELETNRAVHRCLAPVLRRRHLPRLVHQEHVAALLLHLRLKTHPSLHTSSASPVSAGTVSPSSSTRNMRRPWSCASSLRLRYVQESYAGSCGDRGCGGAGTDGGLRLQALPWCRGSAPNTRSAEAPMGVR